MPDLIYNKHSVPFQSQVLPGRLSPVSMCASLCNIIKCLPSLHLQEQQQVEFKDLYLLPLSDFYFPRIAANITTNKVT